MISFNRFFFTLWFCFGLLLQAQIFEPVSPQGPKIQKVTVEFVGAQTISPERVKALLSTQEGSNYSDDNVSADIQNLYKTGYIDNVDFVKTNVAGGVSVVVKIDGRGGVGNIFFEGNTVFSQDKLQKELELESGKAIDDQKLAVAQREITDMYSKKGYTDVAVGYEVTKVAENGMSDVIFRINEGGRGLIDRIDFTGNTVFSRRELRSKLKSKQDSFWRLWGKAGKLDMNVVQEDIKIIEKEYQKIGYIYVKVDHRREVVDAENVKLIYDIVEGQSYTVASMTISGITIYQPEDLYPAVLTEVGQNYNGEDIEGDEKMIRDYYGSRGYADARVTTHLSSAGGNAMHVNFEVYEGTKSYLRKVNISGNTKTKDEVIRRELPFSPGDELNTVKIDTATKVLESLNYFERAGDPNPLTIRPVDTPAQGFKDIEVNVTEKSTRSLSASAGFSSIDNLVGMVELQHNNFDIADWDDFTGGGQRFNARIRYGLQRRDISASWFEPWFMGRKLGLTIEPFYRDVNFLSNNFDQRNYGLTVGLRKPITDKMFMDLNYTIQNISILDVDSSVVKFLEFEEGSYTQSKLDFTITRDTRDSLYLTRKGHKIEAGLTASGLGGDVKLYGASIEASQYFNLPGDTILILRGSAQHVSSWGNNEHVPIFERQFMGGLNNLRGFDFRDVGPKDQNGEPIGGNTSWFASVEYTFPILEKVRGAVFYDVGMVSGDINLSAANGGPVVGDGLINSNFGLGLRLYFLPVGPVTLDFGIPMSSDEFNDSGGKFQFSIGFNF
jgi:outer membrane protein insertion porin family